MKVNNDIRQIRAPSEFIVLNQSPVDLKTLVT